MQHLRTYIHFNSRNRFILLLPRTYNAKRCNISPQSTGSYLVYFQSLLYSIISKTFYNDYLSYCHLAFPNNCLFHNSRVLLSDRYHRNMLLNTGCLLLCADEHVIALSDTRRAADDSASCETQLVQCDTNCGKTISISTNKKINTTSHNPPSFHLVLFPVLLSM